MTFHSHVRISLLFCCFFSWCFLWFLGMRKCIVYTDCMWNKPIVYILCICWFLFFIFFLLKWEKWKVDSFFLASMCQAGCKQGASKGEWFIMFLFIDLSQRYEQAKRQQNTLPKWCIHQFGKHEITFNTNCVIFLEFFLFPLFVSVPLCCANSEPLIHNYSLYFQKAEGRRNISVLWCLEEWIR